MHGPPDPLDRTRLVRPTRAVPFLVVLVLAGVLVGLGRMTLWGIREGRFAACTVDIVRHGRWLVPLLQGEPRLKKPPLPYWLSACVSLAVGKVDEWTLRAPGVLYALGVVLVTYWLAAQVLGRAGGLLAGLMTATSVYFVIEFRQAGPDPPLACFATAAIGSWWKATTGQPVRPVWWLVAWGFVGLCGAVKGPAVAPFLVAPIVAHVIWPDRWRRPAWWLIIAGPAVALAIALAWPVAVWLSQPRVFDVLGDEVVQKVTSTHSRRSVTHYVEHLPIYLLPWSVFVCSGLATPFLKRYRAWRPAMWFAWLWVLVPLTVLTLMGARKSLYLMPAMPALAVLGAAVAVVTFRRLGAGGADFADRLAAICQVVLLAAMGLVTPLVFWLRAPRVGWHATAFGVVVVATVTVLIARLRNRPVMATAVMATVLASSYAALYYWSVPRFNEQEGSTVLARRIEALVPPGQTIYCARPEPSLYMYVDRPLMPVAKAALADGACSIGDWLLLVDCEAECLAARGLTLQPVATDPPTRHGRRSVLARVVSRADLPAPREHVGRD